MYNLCTLSSCATKVASVCTSAANTFRKHWDQLSVLERQGAWPIEAYFRKGQCYHLKNCFSQMKFMRKAPIYPEREM